MLFGTLNAECCEDEKKMYAENDKSNRKKNWTQQHQ